MELELSTLLRAARRRWWLLVLVPVLAGAAAYFVVGRQAPLYSATATLLINTPSQAVAATDYNAIRGSQSLTETYRQLATTRPVLDPVIAQLGLPFDLNTLAEKVSAKAEPATQLVRISVSDTDPERAATIANAIAAQFRAYIAQQTLDLTGPSRQALNDQIAETQAEIDAVNQEIRALEQAADAASPENQARRDSLRATLAQLQEHATDLLLAGQQMDLNGAAAQAQVTVAEPAIASTAPYAPRTTLYALLAVVAGLLIAAGAVALIEYLDNTVKADTDFPNLIDAPLLSTVGSIPKLHAGLDQVFVLKKPQSTAAEAIRLLRTNIEFAAVSREIASLVVTSPGPAEGKSTVTANLAVTMALAGFSTLVIDADLRRPSQHRIFDVPNERGLTSLLTNPDRAWSSAAVELMPSKLWLIPSGPLPPNPADLLSSDRLHDLIRAANETVDLLIVDSPPILAATDALIIAPHTDGAVLVSRAGRTRREALRRASDSLRQGTIRLVGVVLNGQTGRHGETYYYQGYYGVAPNRREGSGGRFEFLKRRGLRRASSTPS